MSRIEVPALTTRSVAGHPWRMFSLLALVQFMVVLDGSIVIVALPPIQADLALSGVGVAWVLDSYLLVFGGFLLLGGRATCSAGAS